MTKNLAQNQAIDAMHERLVSDVTVDRLALIRNSFFGGAAVCLAILIALTQVGANDPSLRFSVFASAFALPLWLLQGAIIEYYILLGPCSYSHYHRTMTARVTVFVMTVSIVALFAAVVAMINFLVPAAAWLFSGTCVTALYINKRFHISIATKLESSKNANSGAPSSEV